MKLDRDQIEAVYTAYRKHLDASDWNALVDLFSEDCSFLAPILAEPIKGRENLRTFVTGCPNVSNRAEWVAIDGNRIVVAWNSRNDLMPNSAGRFRGVSTLVINSAAQICEFEEWFDTAAIGVLMEPTA